MSENNKKSTTCFAPAKVNLFLHVTGELDNGYHTLQSLVSFADFGDSITIEEADDFLLKIDNAPDLEINDDNLVVKAAKLLCAELNQPLNFSIHLTKNTPMGAGLGGGSADAAAIIKCLLKFWDIKIKNDNLQKLLLQLGADVPICYHGQSAYMEDIGEDITPCPIEQEIHAVLIHPKKHCSTADIFKAYGRRFTEKIKLLKSFDSSSALISYLKENQNDLTNAAIKNTPEISDVLKAISEQNDCEIARMSGSGSACFGLFKSKNAAHDAAVAILKEKPHWWVRPVILNKQ